SSPQADPKEEFSQLWADQTGGSRRVDRIPAAGDRGADAVAVHRILGRDHHLPVHPRRWLGRSPDPGSGLPAGPLRLASTPPEPGLPSIGTRTLGCKTPVPRPITLATASLAFVDAVRARL